MRYTHSQAYDNIFGSITSLHPDLADEDGCLRFYGYVKRDKDGAITHQKFRIISKPKRKKNIKKNIKPEVNIDLQLKGLSSKKMNIDLQLRGLSAQRNYMGGKTLAEQIQEYKDRYPNGKIVKRTRRSVNGRKTRLKKKK